MAGYTRSWNETKRRTINGKAGVCGKKAKTAELQDKLTGELIGLAKTCVSNTRTKETDRIILEGLFVTITNVN